MHDLTWFPLRPFIDGDWLDTAETAAVTNPATGETIAEIALAGTAEAQAAVDAAATALPAWSATPAPRRAELLMAFRDLLLTHREPLARLLTSENGKPIAQARGEVDYAASFFRWFGEEARRLEGRSVPHPEAAVESWVEYVPLGVVGAITPWNFPLALGAKKLAAALAAGCTVVLKPAPQTPLSSLAAAWLFAEAGFPAGTVNVVCGPAPEIAGVLIEDRQVRCLSLTGSVATGRKVGEAAGRQLKHVHLELGGNAPFIVLADADLDYAAEQLLKLKLMTNGQTCVCANRLFVEEAVAPRFLELLLERIAALRIGNPLDESVDLGPLIDAAAVDKVAGLERAALQGGAKRLCGGAGALPEGLTGKNWFPLTLIGDVTNDMACCQEEIFGPLLPVQTFRDDEALLAAANDTSYGLAGYLYGRDAGRLRHLARALEVGIVGINDFRPLRAEVPFGGVKDSGLGREGGHEGLHDYLVAKSYSHRHRA